MATGPPRHAPHGRHPGRRRGHPALLLRGGQSLRPGGPAVRAVRPDREARRQPREEPAPPGRPRQRRRDPPVRPRARPVAIGAGGPADRARARAGLADRRHRPPARGFGWSAMWAEPWSPMPSVRRPPFRRVLRALRPPHQGPLGRPAARLRGLAARVLVGGPRVRPRDRPADLQRGRPRHPAQEHQVHDGQRRRPLHARRRRRARARGLRRRGRPQPGRHRPGPGPEHGPAQPAPARPARPAPLRDRVPAQRRDHALAQLRRRAPARPQPVGQHHRRAPRPQVSRAVHRPHHRDRRPRAAVHALDQHRRRGRRGHPGRAVRVDVLGDRRARGPGLAAHLPRPGQRDAHLLVRRPTRRGHRGSRGLVRLQSRLVAPRRQVPPGAVRAAQGPRRAARMAPLPPQPVRRVRGHLAARGRVERRRRATSRSTPRCRSGSASTRARTASSARSRSRSAREIGSW